MTNEMLTVHELSKQLGSNYFAVNYAIGRLRIKAVKRGNIRFLMPADVARITEYVQLKQKLAAVKMEHKGEA